MKGLLGKQNKQTSEETHTGGGKKVWKRSGLTDTTTNKRQKQFILREENVKKSKNSS